MVIVFSQGHSVVFVDRYTPAAVHLYGSINPITKTAITIQMREERVHL